MIYFAFKMRRDLHAVEFELTKLQVLQCVIYRCVYVVYLCGGFYDLG
jgi:hypothetical protein